MPLNTSENELIVTTEVKKETPTSITTYEEADEECTTETSNIETTWETLEEVEKTNESNGEESPDKWGTKPSEETKTSNSDKNKTSGTTSEMDTLPEGL